ncbi:hypothetical protein IG631_02670 [Alternaria alternata]|nr:hypothetical protein IG631_02670 [Alternaria alternata]
MTSSLLPRFVTSWRDVIGEPPSYAFCGSQPRSGSNRSLRAYPGIAAMYQPTRARLLCRLPLNYFGQLAGVS